MIVNSREFWYNVSSCSVILRLYKSWIGGICLNKKLRQLVEPGILPYLLMLLVAAAAIYYRQYEFAIGAGAALIVLLFTDLVRWKKQEEKLSAYVESRIYEADSAKSSTLINFPLPIVIFKLDNARIVWGNEQFFHMCGETGTRLDASISDLVPQFSGGWLLEGKSVYPTLLELGGRKYRLHGSLICSEQEKDSVFMGITYWVDVTDYDNLRILYENTRPVAGIIVIDNLDELMKNQPDRVKNDLAVFILPVPGILEIPVIAGMCHLESPAGVQHDVLGAVRGYVFRLLRAAAGQQNRCQDHSEQDEEESFHFLYLIF